MEAARSLRVRQQSKTVALSCLLRKEEQSGLAARKIFGNAPREESYHVFLHGQIRTSTFAGLQLLYGGRKRIAGSGPGSYLHKLLGVLGPDPTGRGQKKRPQTWRLPRRGGYQKVKGSPMETLVVSRLLEDPEARLRAIPQSARRKPKGMRMSAGGGENTGSRCGPSD